MNKQEEARKWIDNCGDSEIRRMYGHHMRSFMGGYDVAQQEGSKERDQLRALLREIELIAISPDDDHVAMKKISDLICRVRP